MKWNDHKRINQARFDEAFKMADPACDELLYVLSARLGKKLAWKDHEDLIAEIYVACLTAYRHHFKPVGSAWSYFNTVAHNQAWHYFRDAKAAKKTLKEFKKIVIQSGVWG